MQRAGPLIAVTMGDPAGIGPEVALQAAASPDVRAACQPVIVGDLSTLQHTARQLRLQLPVVPVVDPAEAYGQMGVPAIDLRNADPRQIVLGQVSQRAGWSAWECIRMAVQLAMGGKVQALVTGPVEKAAIRLAGLPFADHGEMFAHLTGVADTCLLLLDGPLRVAHVSTHVALRRAVELVTRERVLRVLRLTHAALRVMGFERPSIGVAGLNPHAGEDGLFGDEEVREIIPAIHLARAEGLAVEGPVAPHMVFRRAHAGMYDAVVAMYHDQGHIPVHSGEYRAISMTLGLPVIRTAVDHGVAFELAGKGQANCQPMADAILLAARMARAVRRPTLLSDINHVGGEPA